MAVVPLDRYPSPLRYPGGKGKLANFVKLLMLRNGLVGAEYVEPYAGGASVALALLFEEYASHVHINDLSRSIGTFWRAVLDQPDELCARIRGVPLNVAEWDRQRAVQADPKASGIDLAFSTFFLNRTSHSGIINGGIIGGRDQRGGWKIDARFSREELVMRIRRISRFRSRITVTALDAKDYLQEQLPTLGSDCLVYLDPPYYVKGADLYEDYYEHGHHEEIAALVRALDVRWIVSYDAAPEIEEMYRRFPATAYSLRYTAATRHDGAERMFFHPKLKIPAVVSPSQVTSGEVAAALTA